MPLCPCALVHFGAETCSFLRLLPTSSSWNYVFASIGSPFLWREGTTSSSYVFFLRLRREGKEKTEEEAQQHAETLNRSSARDLLIIELLCLLSKGKTCVFYNRNINMFGKKERNFSFLKRAKHSKSEVMKI